MRTIALLLFVSLAGLCQAPAPQPQQAGAPGKGGRGSQFAGQKRIRALVISGGCCHDYRGQDKILMDLFADVLPVDWTILYEGGAGSDARVALYDTPNWAKGFDVVIHNECYANVADEKFIRQITSAHKMGAPAMVIHCTMHSYRAAAADDWREFLGVTTRRHTRAHNIAVKVTNRESSITRGMPGEFSTPTDELYVIERLWPTATALATATSPEEDHKVYPVIWTNDYNGTRVFGTTLGHADSWNDPIFRDMLVRAFKWTIKRE